MSSFDYEQLDPGIRDVVRFLHDLGYETTDSGDGVSKPDMDCALPMPHVAVRHEGPITASRAYLLRRQLRERFGGEWEVQVSYDTKDEHVLYFAYKDGIEK